MDMRLCINGIERSVQVIPAPQFSYCISDDSCFPMFPLFVGVCEAYGREKELGSILMCPIFDNNSGYASISVNEIKNEVTRGDVKRCILNYHEIAGSDSLKKCVEVIMPLFAARNIPVLPSAQDYIEDIMEGLISEYPEINEL